MKLYREDGQVWFDSSSAADAPRSRWRTNVEIVLYAAGFMLVGMAIGIDTGLGLCDVKAASAVEPDGPSVADLGADAACCPRFRPPQQADLDALTAAGGSLSVYVDEGGSCATLWHNGQPIRGYAGHPLDAARGCLEAWIAEGGGR